MEEKNAELAIRKILEAIGGSSSIFLDISSISASPWISLLISKYSCGTVGKSLILFINSNNSLSFKVHCNTIIVFGYFQNQATSTLNYSLFANQKCVILYDTISDHGYTPVPKSVLQKFLTSRCPTVEQNISKSR